MLLNVGAGVVRRKRHLVSIDPRSIRVAEQVPEYFMHDPCLEKPRRQMRTQGQGAIHPELMLLALFLFTTCTSGPAGSSYRMHTLSSGERVKVLGVSRMTFPKSGPALMLKYQTDLNMADTAALQAEAERIWADFRSEAESAGVSGAVLSATSAPSGGIISHGRGYNFVYVKRSDGSWRESRR